jgi:ABC-type transport system substrate-binding protein
MRSLLLSALLALSGLMPASADPAIKVLRYAFEEAETTLDPAKAYDLYSRSITPHIFEGLYGYDHLARPVRMKPLVAAAMPEHSDDFRSWTIRIRPGIYFADDPAFKGSRRELVAEDFIYTLKRFADPANKSALWSDLEENHYLGLNELHRAAVEGKKPFDYDHAIEGARALDRYTIRFKLQEPRPRFINQWANSDQLGAVAREVVEFYGDRIDEHPVGTGPFRLAQWKRASRLVLERNPSYRERYYDAEPATGDAAGQALAARFKGRRLPMIDRVEVSIISEQQPRWLSFLGREADFVERVGAEFIDVAMPGGRLAPNLAKQGIVATRQVEPGNTYLLFNVENPTVGGYTPEKVALRRAIGLGMDTGREILTVWKNAAVHAQSAVAPHTSAYDPGFKSEMSEYDPARAKALLDLYGYIDRNGDGWRERPDGSPLLLRLTTQPDQRSRSRDELFKKNMDALGLRVELAVVSWPEALKAARAGGLMMWTVGGLATDPDSQDLLSRYEGSHIGDSNMARFQRPEVDRLLERMKILPDGAERQALFRQVEKFGVAYLPYKFRVSRVVTDMSQPWLVGYRRPVFWTDWWEYVDIDESLRPAP